MSKSKKGLLWVVFILLITVFVFIVQDNNFKDKISSVTQNKEENIDLEGLVLNALPDKDKVYLIGGNISSSYSSGLFDNGVFLSTDENGIRWKEVLTHKDIFDYKQKQFPPRMLSASVYFNNKLWVMGGWSYPNMATLNDVWSSADGKTWKLETQNAAWGKRGGHSVVVFNNKMFLYGGGGFADVWSSTDGKNWVKEADISSMGGARTRHSLVVFNNKIWSLGGYNTSAGLVNDIWSSHDGKNWTHEGNAQWSPRKDFGAFVFDKKMWVVGGSSDDDVWSSIDGKTWNLVTTNAPWGKSLTAHKAYAAFGKMWVEGGEIPQVLSTNYDFGQLWSSTDGKTWTKVKITATNGGLPAHPKMKAGIAWYPWWLERSHHQVVVVPSVPIQATTNANPAKND